MYREIVETSPDGIWVVDLDGGTRYANTAMARLLGRSPEEMAGLSMYDAHDEDGRRQLAEHFAELRAGRANPADVECLFVRKDGSGVWVLVSESLLAADDENPARAVLRVTDWTERRVLLDRLRRHQEALAEAERIARVGSWRYHPDSDLLVPSAGLCAALGVDPTTAPRDREAFLALVHPEDRDRLDRASAAAVQGGESFEAEVRIRTPEGYRWFDGRGRVGDDGDGGLAHTGTFRDVHDARETQAALEDAALQNALMQATAAAANRAESVDDLLRMTRDLVLAHDDWDRGRAYVPDAAGRVRPYYVDDADRAADDALPTLVTAERALAQQAHDTRDVVWGDQPPDRHSVAFPVVHDGDVALVVVIGEAEPFVRPEMIASMVTQAAVQIAHVVERERAARELAAARDAAEEGSRQKSEFLATMSHEIRTPLNGVIGLNDLLLRTDLDAEQQRLATGVQVSSRALLALINDVLDFSKIEAGRLELERIEFDVRAVFDQVASVLGEGARSRGLDLVVACHADVPEVLVGDPTRLSQVLTNLGANAVKFTEVGTVRIEASRVLTGSPADDDEVVLRVDVTDTGVGIAPEQQAEVFQRFVQADTSTTRRYGGTGLGLAISREIVEALGGEIGVESRLGEGSHFWITVRMRAAGDRRVDDQDRAVRRAVEGRRVLVVDDVEHNRLILSEQVGWWGVRSATAASVAEALDALEEAHRGQDPFELVLLDFAMPEQDGFDLARAVRSRPHLAGAPLVMLSSALPPRADRLAAAGIAGCATKPVLSATLRTLLLAHLRPDLAPASPSAVGTAARPRVLVVEDNPVNQMVAAGLLDALGYDADTVDDGLAGVHAVRRAREDAGSRTGTAGYALVLMDLQMPRLDGFDATRAIREAEAAHGWPRLPVVAMTASAVQGERERCLEAGMDDFLTKPVDSRVLGDLAARWVVAGAGPQEGLEPDRDRLDQPVPDRDRRDGSELDRDRLDELRELTPDHAYLDRVIERFGAHSRALLDDLTAAVGAGDADAVRAVAHSLKGSVTNLGLVRSGELAQVVEQRGAQGELAGLPELLPDLVRSVERGHRLLLDYRAAHDGGPAPG